MDFRLIYNGVLPSQSDSNSRIKQKNEIRRKIHLQLRELWSVHPALRGLRDADPQAPISLTGLADRFKRTNVNDHIYRFAPLIGAEVGTACSLDILFLRRDGPGQLVVDGGDIDNRIKVLLDGLRMPHGKPEMSTDPPKADEDPFLCLLEDDKYVTDLRISTDRLLPPLEPGEKLHDVSLIIRVKTSVFDRQKAFPWILEMI